MPVAPNGKSTKVNYQDKSNTQKSTGTDHTSGNPPTPRPGQGAVLYGSSKIKQPKGQPPLRY